MGESWALQRITNDTYYTDKVVVPVLMQEPYYRSTQIGGDGIPAYILISAHIEVSG